MPGMNMRPVLLVQMHHQFMAFQGCDVYKGFSIC
nr:hypothetical protein Q903MT_gene2954 [Picea sitchensis]